MLLPFITSVSAASIPLLSLRLGPTFASGSQASDALLADLD
ncbi:hypothetical protein Cadr_000002427 [Camelus dromedarius]|uniref:Uncharacterized protein n=1 Tax=Camelus dromedarius TaxID=9838 RepID=A0A5N4C482_CAMDR|nr:hypothetical protein Cadr_000002427 [Camelus dromedarius]